MRRGQENDIAFGDAAVGSGLGCTMEVQVVKTERCVGYRKNWESKVRGLGPSEIEPPPTSYCANTNTVTDTDYGRCHLHM